MVFLILFGILDLIGALFFALAHFDIGVKITLIFALYLILKSLLFLPNIPSFVDIFSAIYILLVLVGFVYPVMSWLVILWLIQKGIFSLFL